MKNTILVSAMVVLLSSTVAIQSAEFDYVLTGGVSVVANENAVNTMIVDVTSTLHIDEAGVISGEGTLTYLFMNPCAWEAPKPVDENNCRIEGVQDGAFSISGSVVESVHRHDDDNPLKDAVFEYADARASERADYAPYRLSITLTPVSLPEENLAFWGLSTSNIEQRTTGAATLGILASGLFDHEFEMIALNAESEILVENNANVHDFSGYYASGTLVKALGQVALTSLSRDWLPDQTDPYVYLSTWIEGPDDRPLSEAETLAIAAYENEGMDDTRADIVEQIEDSMYDLVEVGALDPILNYQVWDDLRVFHGLPSLTPKQP